MTIHLTFTGRAAGALFCDMDKNKARELGHTFSHLPYTNINRFFTHPDLCKECVKEYESCAEAVD